MKNKFLVLCLMALVSVASLYAQEDDLKSDQKDKLSFELEFNASLLSADSEGVVDSMVDSGFNEDGTKIGLSYEGELWGASAALKFGNENLRFLSGEIGEMFAGPSLTLDELYGWVKPFGEHLKFSGGIFSNTDGVADYTDDIDDFGMGAFVFGEDGEPFSEPTEHTNTALVNGFLTDLLFGPVTLQVLLAPNYSGESASELVSGLLTQMTGTEQTITTKQRFLRIGGRIIADLGVGTVSALFKTSQWPMKVVNAVEGDPNNPYPGLTVNWATFGAYFDFTAVENVGISVGYTGFLPLNNESDVDNVLYSGIDLRATWTGIEGLSISTHNNISFAQGAEKDWMGILGKGASFFTLYNAVGATKELTEQFSVNAELANIFSKTDNGDAGKIEYDNFALSAKFIAKVTENAAFNAGLRLDIESYGDAADALSTFSIPIGIVLSF